MSDLDKKIDCFLYGYYQAQSSAGGQTPRYREIFKKIIGKEINTVRIEEINEVNLVHTKAPFSHANQRTRSYIDRRLSELKQSLKDAQS